MKKLVSLLAIFLLASCGDVVVPNESPTTEPTSIENSDPENPLTIDEDWTYIEDEEEEFDIAKDGVEVSYIEAVGFPKNGIMVGHWDDHDIKIVVTYSDNSTAEFPFKEKNIPIEHRHYLGELGRHELDIVINGSTLRYSFDIVKNPDFKGYKCTFMDLRGTTQLLLEKTVGYYETVIYSGPMPESKVIDDDNIECFIGWDYPLVGVHQDMYYHAQFRDVEKRFYGDAIVDESHMVISTSKKDNQIRALAYLGRVHCAALNYGDPIYHTAGNEEEAFKFSSLNPYGLKWNELNQNIFDYGIHYTHQGQYGALLYGTTGAFSNVPTILNDFEGYYEVESKSFALDNGKTVDTSIVPSFSTCYSLAEANMDKTLSLDKDAESGYYRIALTTSFDVYISVSFTKVTDNRYSLVQGSKCIFSPVPLTGTVRLEYSDSVNFTKTIEKPLAFSTETLYNIANGLDW